MCFYSTTKSCSKCRQEKPLSEFNKNKRTRDGLQSWCKRCLYEGNRKRQQSNPEATREYQRAYREANRNKVSTAAKIRARSHYLKNRELVLQRTARYAAAHPGVRKKAQARYYRIHAEKRQAYSRLYWRNNPERNRQHSSKRRAREYNASISKVDYAAIWKRDRGICHICGKKVARKDNHFDHIIPLSRGGSHSEDNIAVSHSWCNLRKGTRLLGEF